MFSALHQEATQSSLTDEPRARCDLNAHRIREVLSTREVLDVREALAGSGYLGIRRLRCEYCNNTVVISGRLPNFYQKQVAISLVMRRLEKGTPFDHQIDVVLASDK